MRAPDRPLARPAPPRTTGRRGAARGGTGWTLIPVAVLAASCVRAPGSAPGAARPLAPLPLRADSVRTYRVAEGVLHHRLWFADGPQTVHVLDVDRAACWTLRARKAGGAAVGRAGTLALTRGLADSGGRAVAGGVNADFFSFTPPGVPVGAHVEDGRLIAGPNARPVFAIDAAGAPWIGRVSLAGSVARETTAAGGLADPVVTPLTGWNRASPDGVALFDRSWGAVTDSAAVGRLFVPLRALRQPDDTTPRYEVVALDSVTARADIPRDGVLLVAAGGSAGSAARTRLAALRVGERVVASFAQPVPQLRDAVGGFPVLVRDGAIDPQVDSAGAVGFRGPNPRTAVGVADAGRRLLLVTVDGRQPARSVGVSLRALATLFQTFGARDALNLDGGGSTTFVVRDATAGLRIANVPSDPAGERPVANALVVVQDGCARR